MTVEEFLALAAQRPDLNFPQWDQMTEEDLRFIQSHNSHDVVAGRIAEILVRDLMVIDRIYGDKWHWTDAPRHRFVFEPVNQRHHTMK